MHLLFRGAMVYLLSDLFFGTSSKLMDNSVFSVVAIGTMNWTFVG